jgi:glycerol kinase
VPHARERAERGELAFGTVDTWLAWKLSSGRHHVTDATNASRTLLLNLRTGDWDDEMLALFNIPRACLPRIVGSSLGADTFDVEVSGHDVPLAGMAGDQQAALFGQTCFTPGMAKNTYGTGCFLLMSTGTDVLVSKNRLLTTIAWRDTQLRYALEGGVFVAGAVVQWLRDGLQLIRSSADIEPLAASVPDNGGVYFVPAFAGLGSPHWDPLARGAMVGLTRGATGAHIARAALESIAFQPLIELRVDGGATVNNLLMQFQADLLGVPVVRPEITETTALGAAYLAGLSVGYWRSQDALARNWRVERRFTPRMSRDEAAFRMGQWSQAVDRARGWAHT